MAKGDNRRPSSIPKKEYDKNFESIFGKKKLNIWGDKDDDLGTGEGDQSGGGSDHNVSEEPDGRPDPKAVPPTEATEQCYACGTPVSFGDSFCGRCGGV